MLQCIGVCKSFPKTNFGLTHVSFRLNKGIHLLIGPNGAGKSTLLRLIAGIMPPDAGYVFFQEQDVYEDLCRYKFRLGYLPQTFGFYEHMTGMEFLRYMAGLKGAFSRLGQEQAEYVIQLLDIRQQCKEKIAVWSEGLKQRLGLAQALLNDPDILLLDEPFCGLDNEETEKIGQLLEQLAKERLVLISSHIMNGLAVNQLLFLMEGRLYFAGHPAAFVDEAEGRVWMADISKKDWLTLQQTYPVGDVVFMENRCRFKIVSEVQPDIPGIEAVMPSLEDAYLWWVRRGSQLKTEEERKKICR